MTKSRKWKTAALSAALRSDSDSLSQELRESIADRLDNQVLEIKYLQLCITDYLGSLHEHDMRTKLAITHLQKNRPECALSSLTAGTEGESTRMLHELAENP